MQSIFTFQNFLASFPEVGTWNDGQKQHQLFSFGGTGMFWMLRKNDGTWIQWQGETSVYMFVGISEEMYKESGKKS